MRDKRIVILGYGNPLRRDDGVGRAVARATGRLLSEKRVSIHVLHQLLPEVAVDVSGASHVMFIDADVRLPAGSWRFESIAADDTYPGLGHHLRPQTLLALARGLGDVPIAAELCSVGPASLELGAELSPQVQTLVPAMAHAVAQRIHRWLAEAPATAGCGHA